MATPAQRAHLLALMDFLVAHGSHVHYPPHDHRGSADAWTWRLSESELHHVLTGGGSVTFDCSQSAVQLCRWVGLRDPNGFQPPYREPGYTGTLLASLPHYSDAGAAYVGALCVFGPGTGEHVSMVHTRGKDPLLWTQGSERGPNLYRLSVEREWHRPPVRFLSVAGL